jgi:hypothetical protein
MNKKMVTQMIAKDRVEWGLLTVILDAHSTEVLHAPPSPPWTSRDIYAHLARWLNNSNKDMEAYCSGGPLSPAVDNFEEVNSRWQKEDSSMSLAEARKKASEAFNKRLNILESIPLNKWDKKLERIANYDGSEHLAAHRGYILLV